jgi:undecaprenyl-diphosphatase
MKQAAIEERRAIPRGRVHVLGDALYTTLRAIAKHVHGFYGAVAAFITVSIVVGAAAASAFAIVAGLVRGGFTQSFDEAILQFFQRYRSDLLNTIMLELTALGAGPTLVMIVLIASVFLWLTNHKWSVYILLMGVTLGQVVNAILKNYFDRPRPNVVELVTDVHSLSFPSGHAMASMVVYGSVCYLVARLEPTRKLRMMTWMFAGAVILTVGLSRMYLGVHYPSDIFAGYLGGLAVLAFVAASVKAVRYFAPRRPETKREEHDLNNTASPVAPKLN